MLGKARTLFLNREPTAAPAVQPQTVLMTATSSQSIDLTIRGS
jgi:hypothetical protein